MWFPQDDLMAGIQNHLRKWFSKGGPRPSHLSPSWEVVPKADSWALLGSPDSESLGCVFPSLQGILTHSQF